MRSVAEVSLSAGFASYFLDPTGPDVEDLLATGQLADRSLGALSAYLETQLAAEEAGGRESAPEGDGFEEPATTHPAVLQ